MRDHVRYQHSKEVFRGEKNIFHVFKRNDKLSSICSSQFVPIPFSAKKALPIGIVDINRVILLTHCCWYPYYFRDDSVGRVERCYVYKYNKQEQQWIQSTENENVKEKKRVTTQFLDYQYTGCSTGQFGFMYNGQGIVRLESN